MLCLQRQSNLHTYTLLPPWMLHARRISARAAVGTGYFPKLVFPKWISLNGMLHVTTCMHGLPLSWSPTADCSSLKTLLTCLLPSLQFSCHTFSIVTHWTWEHHLLVLQRWPSYVYLRIRGACTYLSRLSDYRNITMYMCTTLVTAAKLLMTCTCKVAVAHVPANMKL